MAHPHARHTPLRATLALTFAHMHSQSKSAGLRYDLNEAETSRDRFAELASRIQDDLDTDTTTTSTRCQKRVATETKIARRIISSKRREDEAKSVAEHEATANAERREANALSTTKAMAKYTLQTATVAAADRQAREAHEATEVGPSLALMG
jgi:hypothetical protein